MLLLLTPLTRRGGLATLTPLYRYHVEYLVPSRAVPWDFE
jgi:hypothetical protein